MLCFAGHGWAGLGCAVRCGAVLSTLRLSCAFLVVCPGVGPHILVPGQRRHRHAAADGGNVRGERGVRDGWDPEDARKAYRRPGGRAEAGRANAYSRLFLCASSIMWLGFGLVWFGLGHFILVRFGLVWFGWFGMVWYGSVWVWFGVVRYGLVRFGSVRSGLV